MVTTASIVSAVNIDVSVHIDVAIYVHVAVNVGVAVMGPIDIGVAVEPSGVILHGNSISAAAAFNSSVQWLQSNDDDKEMDK
jgi:hypothetical protein